MTAIIAGPTARRKRCPGIRRKIRQLAASTKKTRARLACDRRDMTHACTIVDTRPLDMRGA
jgi:hypothetical protein